MNNESEAIKEFLEWVNFKIDVFKKHINYCDGIQDAKSVLKLICKKHNIEIQEKSEND